MQLEADDVITINACLKVIEERHNNRDREPMTESQFEELIVNSIQNRSSSTFEQKMIWVAELAIAGLESIARKRDG